MGIELVAIGTSLGGLRALTALLGGLPAGFPVPIVVVQHRAIETEGVGLARLLQERTTLTVVEAEDKMALDPGWVYIAPADYHLLVEARGVLALSTERPIRAARPSIDALFQSAADAYGPTVAGVLLTGASADGAEGLATIKAGGGFALVEDPRSAEAAAMPAAGMAAAAVDYVLPIAQMANHLISMVEGTRT
jgi:two-component system, chemotaxis family, protein-glutamate methylesterase/glutaminase